MLSPSTPFPVIELAPEPWRWPTPPFAWYHTPAPAHDVAQPCVVETARGRAVEGELLGFDPAAARLVFRPADRGPTGFVSFGQVARLTLTTPLTQAPRRAGVPLECVPAAAQEREYRLERPKGAPPLTGRTAGHVKTGEGLYLFTPTDEERSLQRVFVPAGAYASCVFGPSAEELAAERWIAGPHELVQAIERQQRMAVLPMGQALLDLGLVTRRQLERALAQPGSHIPLGERLLASGVISKADLNTALAYKLGYPFVDLTRFPIDLSVVRMLPLRLAAQHLALPLMVGDKRLIVAVDRPSRTAQLHTLRVFAGLKIVPVLASKSQIMMKLADLAHKDVWSHNVLGRLMFSPTTV